jgi:hypothetical protein
MAVLLAGCGSSGSSSTEEIVHTPPPKPPPKVKISAQQVDTLSLGVTQSMRGEAAEFGENADYRVRCRQLGETDKAKCQVTPFVEGKELVTYTRTITFDPENPARCSGELIECPAGRP